MKEIKENIYTDDEYHFPNIARNIKKYRVLAKMSQQNLADITGISRQYICDIENSVKRSKRISINYLTRISDALNIFIGDFFIPITEEELNKILDKIKQK